MGLDRSHLFPAPLTSVLPSLSAVHESPEDTRDCKTEAIERRPSPVSRPNLTFDVRLVRNIFAPSAPALQTLNRVQSTHPPTYPLPEQGCAPMKNAHERFGRLAYQRRSERTATNIRVHMDAFVGEERGKAHLVSVTGGDVELGALSAAFANGDSFTAIDPSSFERIVSLGDKPLCFRGSITIAGRKRPLRHLVACSQEIADTTSNGKVILIGADSAFIWSSLVRHYGLPATPEWGPWVIEQLHQQKRIQDLPGFGYCGVSVKATRKELLALLRRGLRTKNLRFPESNGAVEWPEVALVKNATHDSRRLPE